MMQARHHKNTSEMCVVHTVIKLLNPPPPPPTPPPSALKLEAFTEKETEIL